MPPFQEAQNGHIDVCTVLLKNNTNVNEKCEDGATPQFQEVLEGHADVCNVCFQNTTQM